MPDNARNEIQVVSCCSGVKYVARLVGEMLWDVCCPCECQAFQEALVLAG